jgi:hypothetical protein
VPGVADPGLGAVDDVLVPAVQRGRWNERADRATRRLDGAPAVPAGQHRVVEHPLHVVHTGVRDVGRLEQVDYEGLVQLGEARAITSLSSAR